MKSENEPWPAADGPESNFQLGTSVKVVNGVKRPLPLARGRVKWQRAVAVTDAARERFPSSFGSARSHSRSLGPVFQPLARCNAALLNAPVTPTPPRLPPSLDCSRHRDPSDGDEGSRSAKKMDVDVKLWVRWEKEEGKLTSLWSKELDDELVESSEDGDLVLALDAASLI